MPRTKGKARLRNALLVAKPYLTVGSTVRIDLSSSISGGTKEPFNAEILAIEGPAQGFLHPNPCLKLLQCDTGEKVSLNSAYVSYMVNRCTDGRENPGGHTFSLEHEWNVRPEGCSYKRRRLSEPMELGQLAAIVIAKQRRWQGRSLDYGKVRKLWTAQGRPGLHAEVIKGHALNYVVRWPTFAAWVIRNMDRFVTDLPKSLKDEYAMSNRVMRARKKALKAERA